MWYDKLGGKCMQFYELDLCGLKRQLPIVHLAPKIKIASFNLLGDRELVEIAAKNLVDRIKDYQFDFLIGPEVKVVPLLQEMAKLLNQSRYIICRKNIMGYMINPIISRSRPSLVINGNDADLIKNKKVFIIDDVVSTGRTIKVMKELINQVGAEIVGVAAVLKQGKNVENQNLDSLIFLQELPIFKVG